MSCSMKSKYSYIFIFSILEFLDYVFSISTDAANNWVVVVNFMILFLLFFFKDNKLFYEIILIWFTLMFLNYLIAIFPQTDGLYEYNYMFSVLGALIKLLFLCLIISCCLKSSKKPSIVEKTINEVEACLKK